MYQVTIKYQKALDDEPLNQLLQVLPYGIGEDTSAIADLP